jgi:glutamate-1-semialdehyde 2,1-aminomutase
MILGHAHPKVTEAVKTAIDRGTSYGAPTELEVELAGRIVDAVPSIEMVRLVSSGTEAVMSALRLARAFTKKNLIIKCEGGYHGHSDALLAKAGSGLATLGIPDTPGVPADFTAMTITVPYNDSDAVRQVLEARGSEIACMILEPVAGNMGVVPPQPNYLADLRELTLKHNVLLLFDEVITGFRLGMGGAQEFFGVNPDLTTLGKIIGGGFPVGAYGGKREIMELIAPSGPVYQAGTLSGNPIAVTAGIETLKILSEPGVYASLERKAAQLENGLVEASRLEGISAQVNRVGSMMTTFFTDQAVINYSTAKTSDTGRYARYFHEMLNRGMYLAPSQFEAAFVSIAHSSEGIESTIHAAQHSLHAIG